MDFTINLFWIGSISMTIGYFISGLEFFQSSKNNRIIIYTGCIVILSLVVNAMDLREMTEFASVIIGAGSFWFYNGTKIRKITWQKFNKNKYTLGIIEYVVGGITLFFWFLHVFRFHSPLNYNAYLLFLGVSQLLFAAGLCKKPESEINK